MKTLNFLSRFQTVPAEPRDQIDININQERLPSVARSERRTLTLDIYGVHHPLAMDQTDNVSLNLFLNFFNVFRNHNGSTDFFFLTSFSLATLMVFTT